MEYSIIRSKRKTVAIQVKDGRVTVRGPLHLTDAQAARVIEKNKRWIENKLKKQENSKAINTQLTVEEIEYLKLEAEKYFKLKIEEYSKIMNLKYSRMKVTGARTRFGSCSSKGNICFSYLLMRYPEAAREYVVVHELAHLIEMNHSHRFYKIIEKYMPDYKERRKLLRI